MLLPRKKNESVLTHGVACCRSIEYKEEYEEAKIAAEKAIEISTHNYNKRRGINTEIKQFKEQKSEAERFSNLKEEFQQSIVHHLLWKLFHIQTEIKSSKAAIEEKKESMNELVQEQQAHDERLTKARKEHATAQKGVMKQEKRVKLKEKEVADKVRPRWSWLSTEYVCTDAMCNSGLT